MVAVSDPRLGETVLDPACGTGGFLVEAFNHLSKQVKTVADRRVLQERSLIGCEPKTLPYLLCQMNLLLHGLDAPQIDPGNSLRFKLTDIGEKDRVDIILTNPPFGGEEEKGIQGNFPEDKQTAETALLFLQLIMRKLRRVGTRSTASPSDQGRGGTRPYQAARAAVVVPNGTLFGDGVCARIKEELLKEFNLHTIVRLPNGVRALHQHPDEYPVLRPLRADARGLVLRTAAARGAEELHQDGADPVRGIRAARELVGSSRPGQRAGGERARLARSRRRTAGRRLQPRPEEPAREGRHNAPAAGAIGCQHPCQRAADWRDHG